MAVDLKSIEVQASGGSNPPFSAKNVTAPVQYVQGFLFADFLLHWEKLTILAES